MIKSFGQWKVLKDAVGISEMHVINIFWKRYKLIKLRKVVL